MITVTSEDLATEHASSIIIFIDVIIVEPSKAIISITTKQSIVISKGIVFHRSVVIRVYVVPFCIYKTNNFTKLSIDMVAGV